MVRMQAATMVETTEHQAGTPAAASWQPHDLFPCAPDDTMTD